ncbi:MAG: copper homeostasis protein CutC [Ruminococcaceae bacterium]|nr:copper homeostasis protein CutC [Oscillospiraceae bacterium]
MSDILVEVCCGSAEDAILAARAGAPRVELCGDLFHGGLTPSLGSLLTVRRKADVGVMAMIRPREGGFCYTDIEFEVCLADAKLMLENGADGLVFGFLHPDGTVDAERTKRLTALARDAGKDAVFHRAIDVTPDWRAALDTLADAGVTRVLTSGQEPDVFYGAETVRQMREYAAGRLQIMPGAGITARNLARVIEETGADQIHVAGHTTRADRSTENNRAIYYGGCLYPPEDRFSILDGGYIRGIVESLGQGR